MIPFRSSNFRHTKDGGVILKYDEIEGMTEEIILDYDSSLLTEPHPLEYDDFLEAYLGANLDYQDIYTPNKETVILGCTIFSEQKLEVFDRHSMKKSYIDCVPGTIVLDNALISGNRKEQENITGLHEGGHFWLHTDQFSEILGQISLGSKAGKICCRKSEIDRANLQDTRSISNAEMWREWQANVFAVTIALPKKSLLISVNEAFSREGIDTKQLIIDQDSGSKYLAEHVIPEYLKSIYNMSKESIRYRLQKTGFYITKKKYEEEHTNVQMSLFDFIQ